MCVCVSTYQCISWRHTQPFIWMKAWKQNPVFVVFVYFDTVVQDLKKDNKARDVKAAKMKGGTQDTISTARSTDTKWCN